MRIEQWLQQKCRVHNSRNEKKIMINTIKVEPGQKTSANLANSQDLKKISRVYIPIVSADIKSDSSEQAKLWVVTSAEATQAELDEADKQKSKNLIPTIAYLSQVSRYESARKAYIAIKNLTQAAPTNFLALDNRRVHSADGAGWVSHIMGNSSDLGIALCLLMDISQSNTLVVAATGELGDAMENPDIFNAVIKPVKGVQQKLQLIIEQKQQGLLPELKLILTPVQHFCYQRKSQNPVLELVNTLKEVAVLEALGVRVIGVKTLAEAARKLNIEVSGVTWHSFIKLLFAWRYKFLLSISIGCMLVFGAWLAVEMTKPVKLEWLPRTPERNAEPYIVCAFNPDGTAVFSDLILNKQRIPEMPTNSQIAWKIRLGDDSEVNTLFYRTAHDWFGYKGLYPTLVMIGKKSGIESDYSIFLPIETDRRIPPGRILSYGWGVDDIEETMLLVIIVNRWHSTNINDLKKNLQANFGTLDKNMNLPAIEQYLAEQSDGSLHFLFTTQTGASNCENTTKK